MSYADAHLPRDRDKTRTGGPNHGSVGDTGSPRARVTMLPPLVGGAAFVLAGEFFRHAVARVDVAAIQNLVTVSQFCLTFFQICSR
jgi:hypothetical protein